ncbi:methionyl-tRNA formyltransferase, mitochondrial [Fopius arisanus]|uniref:Methionyl-tRNA formyltransferase, mitochondrial n=1 Tax=Fopius arisanus TaxID=64838 RepID=A0A9R1TED2_9HYME|nr:PREDICTED: methionyl-tRNA formyltransferase, mitochondrial [Fopius arisanus]
MVRAQLVITPWKYLSFSPKPLKTNFFHSTSSQQSETSKCGWKVLFFGTDEFALESLKRLHQEYRSKRHVNHLEAVTAYEGDENAVTKYAQDHGIKIHHWPMEACLDFDIGLVVSFGRLIPSRIIKSFPLGMINVHASLLPRWRGAAPIIHALMNGDRTTGVTIMKIAPKKFDVGEIINQKEIQIDDHETQIQLHKRLASMGGDLLMETLGKLPDIINSGIAQSPENVTYAPKIQKNISIVKWKEMTARDVYNLQRALTGIFPLKTTFQGKSVKIFGVKLVKKIPRDCYERESNPGKIYYDKNEGSLLVQCKNDSWVTVDEIALAGKPKMSATDFNNGFFKNRWDRVLFFGVEQQPNNENKINKRVLKL